MTRDVLQSILREATGLTEKGSAFRVANEHRVTLYLGTEAGSIEVQWVTAIQLHDTFVEITAPEPGKIFTSYESVHTIGIKAPKEAGPKKAGFA